MATNIRILVYDKGDSSRSLLKQLGRKHINFYDTSRGIDHQNLIPAIQHSLAVMRLEMSGSATYRPYLDDLLPPGNGRFVRFEDWWNAPVMLDSERNVWTRKDIVLIVANKDGGAHVDSKLPEKYWKLTRTDSSGWKWTVNGNSVDVKDAVFAAVRQMAHEVMRTLEPNISPQQQMEGRDRNKPCPCGSGKKWKDCHGKPG
jgi:hypothetical protein